MNTQTDTNKRESPFALMKRLYKENYHPSLQRAYTGVMEQYVQAQTHIRKDGHADVCFDGSDLETCVAKPRCADDIDAERFPFPAEEAGDIENIYFRLTEEVSRYKAKLFRDAAVQSLFACAFTIEGTTARQKAHTWLDDLQKFGVRYAFEHTPTGKLTGQEYVPRDYSEIEAFCGKLKK